MKPDTTLDRRSAEKDLLRRLRKLQKNRELFERSARNVLTVLGELPDEEVEFLATREANLQGALECLLDDDLARHLAELALLLEEGFTSSAGEGNSSSAMGSRDLAKTA